MASIIFTISDEKLNDFKDAFLSLYPIPNKYSSLSEIDWIKLWGKNQYQTAYDQGKVFLIKQAAEAKLVIDKEIIT